MSHLVDEDFARRVAEYQRKTKKGVAFQAEGTLGGKRGHPARAAWRPRPVAAFLRFLNVLIILKVLSFHAAQMMGYEVYASDLVEKDAFFAKAKSVVLYPDPISVNISNVLTMTQLYLAIELRRIF